MYTDLKNKLLQTEFFIDNQYLDKYIELVMANIETKATRGKTNKHHIIPKYCFKLNNMTVDNSGGNIVNLLYTDHIIAHYLLAMCSKDSESRLRNSRSIRFILKGKSLGDFQLELVDFDAIQKMYEEGRQITFDASHSIEACKKVSESLLGRKSPNKGNFKNGQRFQPLSHKQANPKNKKLSDIASQRTGDSNSFYGKHHTQEMRDEQSRIKGKPVAMVDLETGDVLQTFTSLSRAGQYLYNNGIVKTKQAVNRILTVCKENNPTHKAYGYNWKFIEKV